LRHLICDRLCKMRRSPIELLGSSEGVGVHSLGRRLYGVRKRAGVLACRLQTPGQFSGWSGSHRSSESLKRVGYPAMERATTPITKIRRYHLMDEIMRKRVSLAVQLDQQTRVARLIK
jgi:hypothetical protein